MEEAEGMKEVELLIVMLRAMPMLEDLEVAMLADKKIVTEEMVDLMQEVDSIVAQIAKQIAVHQPLVTVGQVEDSQPVTAVDMEEAPHQKLMLTRMLMLVVAPPEDIVVLVGLEEAEVVA